MSDIAQRQVLLVELLALPGLVLFVLFVGLGLFGVWIEVNPFGTHATALARIGELSALGTIVAIAVSSRYFHGFSRRSRWSVLACVLLALLGVSRFWWLTLIPVMFIH